MGHLEPDDAAHVIDTQNKERDQCATGSWDPAKPTADPWGTHGGRLMMTSLGALTLEVYYRYLPLYKLDKKKKSKPKGRWMRRPRRKRASRQPRTFDLA